MRELIKVLIVEKENMMEHHRQMAEKCNETLHTLHALLDQCRREPVSTYGEPLDVLTSRQEQELLRQLKPGLGICKKTTLEKADPTETVLPRHVSNNFVIAYLEVSQATFYRHITGKLLTVVEKIGSRSYYMLDDLIALMKRKDALVHQKGAWTFSKLARQQRSGGK